MEYISTSALANELDIKSTDLFEKLRQLGWIERQNEKWVLTGLGKEKGGQTKQSQKFGDYVVWPENISLENSHKNEKSKFLNATAIGKHFDISSQRLNLIFSELGWVEKNLAGWQITKLGKGLGGRQYEHETSGGTYVLWPESMLLNKNLTAVFKEVSVPELQQKLAPDKESQQTNPTSGSFREKFPATLRTKDGHMVRSRAEVIIDNALYDYRLAHAYERKLPIEEEL